MNKDSTRLTAKWKKKSVHIKSNLKNPAKKKLVTNLHRWNFYNFSKSMYIRLGDITPKEHKNEVSSTIDRDVLVTMGC